VTLPQAAQQGPGALGLFLAGAGTSGLAVIWGLKTFWWEKRPEPTNMYQGVQASDFKDLTETVTELRERTKGVETSVDAVREDLAQTRERMETAMSEMTDRIMTMLQGAKRR